MIDVPAHQDIHCVLRRIKAIISFGITELTDGKASKRAAYSEVGAEDVRVAASHQQDTLHALAQQLRGVQVLQNGLEAAHHQLHSKEN